MSMTRDCHPTVLFKNNLKNLPMNELMCLALFVTKSSLFPESSLFLIVSHMTAQRQCPRVMFT